MSLLVAQRTRRPPPPLAFWKSRVGIPSWTEICSLIQACIMMDIASLLLVSCFTLLWWPHFIWQSSKIGNIKPQLGWLQNIRGLISSGLPPRNKKSLRVAVSFGFVPSRPVPLRFVSFRFVPFRTVSYRTVSYRTVSYLSYVIKSTPDKMDFTRQHFLHQFCDRRLQEKKKACNFQNASY